RAADAPQAVRAWFYPGDNYGNAFVYPQRQAAALARANNQPVPSMSGEAKNELSELRNTPLMIQQPGDEQTRPEPQSQQQPTPQPQQLAQTTTHPVTPPEPHPEAQQPQAQNAQKPAHQASQPQQELPQTASDMPLIGLLGVISLALAGALRLARRRRA
ncbi:MAG TPA: LPXTG cell wall anchor domain-containing protein, partial [Phycisphaerae bacterium]|nr:LPXTG cell wall anchor domain-containing protein [Phycisphaerae bacterium]